MEDKHLDLDVPLLSVRRFSVPSSPSLRSSAPFYKSDLKSGPLRNPGLVPFFWEQKPGQPKPKSDRILGNPNPNPNPNSILEDKAMGDELVIASEEDDEFSDAFDTLSRTESFFMNCSISGLSGVPDSSGGFYADPQIRDLMMDRFLPAAKAMATGSPQCVTRKPLKIVERNRAPLPYQHRPNFFARYPHDGIESSDCDEDDDDDYLGSGNFTSKACGFLPRLCMKSSFCLLNQMLAVKVGGRKGRLRHSTSWRNNSVGPNNGLLSQAENELWEAVYSHKLKLGVPLEGEGGNQSISKTNLHSQWNDSQKVDGSSCCHYGGSQEAFEVLKRNAKDCKIDGIESLEKDGEKRLSVNSKMLNYDHLDSEFMVSEVIVDNERGEENLGLERHNGFVLQHQSSELYKSENIAPEMVDQQNTVKDLNCSDGSLLLNVDGKPLIDSKFQYLIPPPLPKTPSESWLSRTLPSFSTKNPSAQSRLGIHMVQRKHGLDPYSTSPRQESDAKPSGLQHKPIPCLAAKQEIPCKIPPTEHSEESNIKRSESPNDQKVDLKPSKPLRRQIRFADVLLVPLSPGSEM